MPPPPPVSVSIFQSWKYSSEIASRLTTATALKHTKDQSLQEQPQGDSLEYFYQPTSEVGASKLEQIGRAVSSASERGHGTTAV